MRSGVLRVLRLLRSSMAFYPLLVVLILYAWATDSYFGVVPPGWETPLAWTAIVWFLAGIAAYGVLELRAEEKATSWRLLTIGARTYATLKLLWGSVPFMILGGVLAILYAMITSTNLGVMLFQDLTGWLIGGWLLTAAVARILLEVTEPYPG